MGDEDDRILNAFGETLFRAMLRRQEDHAARLDVTLMQAHALRLLRDGPVCAGRLADELGVTPSAATQLTDRLGRKGLVERRAVEGDRRSVLVGLTDEGERAVDGFRARRRELFAAALARMSGHDRASVLSAIAKLTDALGESDSGTNSKGKGPASKQGKQR